LSSADTPPTLAALRRDIDSLNVDLLALLQRRASAVMEIARVKRAQGLEGHDPGREE